MTTGNMILIENKKIYMSIPFCGDMEPEANGKFAYYLLQHLDSKGELKNAVAKLDSLKYNYVASIREFWKNWMNWILPDSTIPFSVQSICTLKMLTQKIT